MRRRGRHSGDVERIYKLCSLLLCYPDDELLAARTELAAAAETVDGEAGRSLQAFCRWWVQEEPLALQQHYVETFDLHKRSGLYVTFFGEGDRRARGQALLRLKRMYRAAGLPMEASGELPDYLPVMLEFAAGAADGRGEIVLREHRPALELLHMALRDRGTPYANLIDAICLAIGEPSAADRARARKLAAAGPPSEMVGLESLPPTSVMPAVEARQ
jgi:nitrate reductase molybdenum cofactor assembly chaperone NarJ/NarW